MPRLARIAPGNWIFHVLNRCNGRGEIFDGPASYREFLWIVRESASRDQMRILAFCAMPNHWHMLLWPRDDGDLGRFVQRVSLRHCIRWHQRNHTIGRGHLYQSRYKSFPVCTDGHLLTVCRYIERNPLRARLVARPEEWPWSSARARLRGAEADRPSRLVEPCNPDLTPLPVEVPRDWEQFLQEPQNERELDLLRTSLMGSHPYGDELWRMEAAARLGLRPQPVTRGRPFKNKPETATSGSARAKTLGQRNPAQRDAK